MGNHEVRVGLTFAKVSVFDADRRRYAGESFKVGSGKIRGQRPLTGAGNFHPVPATIGLPQGAVPKREDRRVSLAVEWQLASALKMKTRPFMRRLPVAGSRDCAGARTVRAHQEDSKSIGMFKHNVSSPDSAQLPRPASILGWSVSRSPTSSASPIRSEEFRWRPCLSSLAW